MAKATAVLSLGLSCFRRGRAPSPEEIWDTYGGDVHVDYEQLKISSLGQPVQFKIRP